MRLRPSRLSARNWATRWSGHGCKLGDAVVGPRLQMYLDTFALIEVSSPDFHRHLFKAWGLFMTRDQSEPRKDHALVGFLLKLALKSVVNSGDAKFGGIFSEFAGRFIEKLGRRPPEADARVWARFLTLLFDRDMPGLSVEAVSMSVLKFDVKTLAIFLPRALRARIILVGTTMPSFARAIERILGHDSLLEIVATALWRVPQAALNTLVGKTISALSRLAEVASSPVQMTLLAMYLGAVDATFREGQDPAVKAKLFSSADTLLDAPGSPEWRYSVQFSVLTFIQAVIGDFEVLPDITRVLFHFLCIDVTHDVFEPLIEALCSLAHADADLFFSRLSPPAPRFVEKMLRLSAQSRHVSTFLTEIFNVDPQRGASAFALASSQLSELELKQVELFDAPAPQRVIRDLTAAGSDPERRGRVLSACPDAVLAERKRVVKQLKADNEWEKEAEARLALVKTTIELAAASRGGPPTNFGCSLATLPHAAREARKILRRPSAVAQTLVDIMWPLFDGVGFHRSLSAFFKAQAALFRMAE